jgi:hypothetical protein
MAGVYRPRHPERTVLYRVLFHYFDRFLTEYESRFEKQSGVIAAIQTFGNKINFHPHLHFLVTEGGVDEAGLFHKVPRNSNEVDPMVCPQCGGTMKVIAFLTDYVVVDRIIDHLKLTFVAERPPPPQIAYQESLVAAETSGEYFS